MNNDNDDDNDYNKNKINAEAFTIVSQYVIYTAAVMCNYWCSWLTVCLSVCLSVCKQQLRRTNNEGFTSYFTQ